MTREILLGASRYEAADVFRGIYERDRLAGACESALAGVDVMITPTVPTHFRVEDDANDRRTINDRLGIYTRFVNFLGRPVLSVPAGFRSDGLPIGVSLVGARGCDDALDALAGAVHEASGAGMGRARTPPSRVPPPATSPKTVRLAVAGAHLRGLPLNHELLSRGARFVRETRTEAAYRFVALPGTRPPKPGLVRLASGGASIAIELWDLPFEGLGALLAVVPSPLAIGTIRTVDGELVKGFVCEAFAAEGAEDISALGDFRAYLRCRERDR